MDDWDFKRDSANPLARVYKIGRVVGQVTIPLDDQEPFRPSEARLQALVHCSQQGWLVVPSRDNSGPGTARADNVFDPTVGKKVDRRF